MTCKALVDIVLVLVQGFFSWCSKKQETVAQFTTEVEFIAAINQALWLRNFLCDLHLKQWNMQGPHLNEHMAASQSTPLLDTWHAQPCLDVHKD